MIMASPKTDSPVVPSARAERRRSRQDWGAALYGLIVAAISAAIIGIVLLA